MANGVINKLTIQETEKYVNIIIPNIEQKLLCPSKSKSEQLELYKLYKNCLILVAPYDFITYNKYLEFNEDKTEDNQGFYHKRKDHLKELFKALNDIEIYDTYDNLLVSMPPRTGKSQTNIRFITWIMGRKPHHTQLVISYSDLITKTFYRGVMSILLSQEFKDVFPHSCVVSQNASDENIWLTKVGQYPTVSFIPIEGSMTGRGEGKDYIFFDDLVSGYEVALSIRRLDKLWGFYTVNSRQRKLKGCKEIHIATPWSVHDPITKLEYLKANDPRTKRIKIPCYDENGESNFNFVGGFDTEYYKEIESLMDELSFLALYKCEPIERQGLLYNVDELKYYFELPDTPPDTIVAICDSKNLGTDYVCLLVAYVYGEDIYIEDLVFNSGLPEQTRPLVADCLLRNKAVRVDIELNNGGNYYAESISNMLKVGSGKTSVRIFFSSSNKRTKIITYSDYVKQHFFFKEASTIKNNKQYKDFMAAVLSWTQLGTNIHDDGVDALAMLSQLVQELQNCAIKFIDRRILNV